MEDSNKKEGLQPNSETPGIWEKGKRTKIPFWDYTTKEMSKRGSQEILEKYPSQNLFPIRINHKGKQVFSLDKGFLRSQKF